MSSIDSYITALIIILVAIVIGIAVYKFLPATVSGFIVNSVTNLLSQFTSGTGL